MRHLSLNVFGSPDVRHAGQPLKFRTRKALALLIYLAIEGGMHSREKITALLWPDSDRSHGRTMLRTTLAYLRDALDGDPQPAHLVVERDALGFDRSAECDLDLLTLEAAFALACAPGGVPHPHADVRLLDDRRAQTLAQLQQAVQRYRGEFLEGFALEDAPDFEEWTRLQREVWHQRMSAIFDRLAQLHGDGGAFPSAIDAATRWVAHDPWNERAYQRLIQLHLAVGDRTSALRAYEACQAILAAEMQTRPAPETTALAEHIRTMPPLDEGVSAPVPIVRPSLPESTAYTPLPTLPESPLVGRTNEFVTLVAVYRAIQHNHAQVVLLGGEAGIGKTRLATDFLGWAAAQGADILQGRAFETSSSLPYQPLVESLRSRVERENAPVDLLSDSWLAELSRLLPELCDRYPDLPPPTADETTARVRLFEAVARLGQALAERAPVILFVDDVHWADAASLDMLHYVGRRWQESSAHILLLLTLRTEALATTPALTTWFASIEHDIRTTRLTLGPFTVEDTVRMLESLAEETKDESPKTKESVSVQDPPSSFVVRPSSVVEEFGRWLYAETRGQPFYVREMLKALLERGLLALCTRADGSWAIDVEATARHGDTLRGLLPTGVREVIRTRLAQLTSAARVLLAAGAVLEHDFSFEHLCQVAGLGEYEGLSALDEVLRSGQFAEGRSVIPGQKPSLPSGSTYNFTHEKIRDVVYTEAGDARRRIFHRRSLEVLEAAAAPPATLAHHAREAGLVEPTFHFSVAAGDAALRLFVVREAIAQYEHARDVLVEQEQNLLANHPISTLQHLYSQLGRAYELDNEPAQARSVYHAMLALARGMGAATIECAALNRLATLAVHERFDLEQAAGLLHEALQVAERIGESVELAETQWNLAQLNLYRLDKNVHAYAERALALARRLGLQELIARNLNILIYANVGFGRWAEAEANAAEACALFRAMGNRAMEVDCLCQAASAQINQGRPHDGIATARTAHTMSEAIENVWGQANSAITLAQGLLDIGAYAEALVTAERGVNLARACGMGIMVVDSLVALGIVHRAMMDLDAARALHLEALSLGEPTGIQLIVEIIASELCADCALAGAWDAAHAYALRVLTDRSYAVARSTQLTLWHQTEILARDGEIDRATEDVRGYGQRLGHSPRYRIPYLRALAVLSEHRHEFDQAIEHLREAARLAETIGLPGELWTIMSHLGTLYQERDDDPQSQAAFTRAAAIVHSLADTIADEQGRATFLAASQVRYVLERAT
jgi:DNA-binding SARP family transcriptional activator